MVSLMKLSEQSVRWALAHLGKFSDTDLFPRLYELEALQELSVDAISAIANIDLGSHRYGPPRRFVVPKSHLSYRVATQLDPIDSIILAAIVYEYGSFIEARRIPVQEERVFSYRFGPLPDGSLYSISPGWTDFWEACAEKGKKYQHAVYVDIADCYNQIYHHNLENRLIDCGLPNQSTKWIMGLLESLTAKVSRGIPVGPHSTHLLAECALLSLDNTIIANGIEFCRYVDDIVLFCNTPQEASVIVYKIADILDKQQRMILQQQKTRIFSRDGFQSYCDNMVIDQPISQAEESIIEIIGMHAESPYVSVDIKQLTDDELAVFDSSIVNSILQGYLSSEESNFPRLRWFLRRLAQVGVPSGVDFCVQHIASHLLPAIGDVCRYLVSSASNYQGDWRRLGGWILDNLEHPVLASNDYFQLSLLSLFGRNSSLNHLERLVRMYDRASPTVRREIVLAAYQAGASDWIRQLKESISGLDPWSKRAVLMAGSLLPPDERRFFLEAGRDAELLNMLLAKWARNSR
jgi:hypothetical protein